MRIKQSKIEYAITALGLTVTEVACIIKEATGLTIDMNGRYLEALDNTQLEAIWQRLSRDPRWHRHAS